MDSILGVGAVRRPTRRIFKREFGTRPCYVYMLLCPDSGEARYVGSTMRVRERKQQHNRITEKPTTPVQRWVNQLLRAGKKPAFHIVAVVYGRHLQEGAGYLVDSGHAGSCVEALLIHQLTRMDGTLLNVTSPRLFKMPTKSRTKALSK